MAINNSRAFEGKVIFSGGEPITIPSAATDPVSSVNGDMYYNTTDNQFRKYENGAWSSFAAGGGSGTVDKFTLDNTDITNKFVTLSSAPANPSDAILNVIGGPVQDYSVDFTITGSTLSWDSLGLEALLASGDKLIIQFS